MALTIRVCVLKRGKWCLVAKGLVKRLQSGDVRENEYHETDDGITRYLNKEQQFSRGVLLIVIATARARGEYQHRRRGSESVFASETQTERSCVLPPQQREREEYKPKLSLKCIIIPFLKFNCIQIVQRLSDGERANIDHEKVDASQVT